MTNVLLKKNCGVGRKGDTVSVSDDYAQRLNESGAGKIVHKAAAPNEAAPAETPIVEEKNTKAPGKKAVTQP